jgi:hypothetical protein
MIAKALRSRTIIFSILVGVLSVLQGFIFEIPVQPHWQAAIGVVLAIVVALLRFITHDSIDDK